MSWLAKLTGRSSEPAPPPSGRPLSVAADFSAIQVQVDRHQYSVADLTLRTFRVYPYDGDLIAKQKLSFKFLLQESGKDAPTNIFCQGYVASVDEKGLNVIFRQPQPYYQQVLINYLLAVRGFAKA